MKDEAKEIVDAFIHEEDKGEALIKALKELDFYYGKKVGDAQCALSKILEGKEVSANSIQQVIYRITTIDLICKGTERQFISLTRCYCAIYR